MNNFMSLIFLLPGLLSLGLSGWLAYGNCDGWGWFLFAGFLLAGAAINK